MDPITLHIEGWEITLTFKRTITNKRNKVEDDFGRAMFAATVATGVPASHIRGRKKSERVVWARSIYSMLLRGQGYSLNSIGQSIHRDHGTVRHEVNKGTERINGATHIDRLFRSLHQDASSIFSSSWTCDSGHDAGILSPPQSEQAPGPKPGASSAPQRRRSST